MDDSKIQIAKRLILAAPPGEYNEVISDVKTLLGSPLDDNMLSNIMREYNHTNLSIIKSAGGDKVLTCKEGELKPSVYLDHGKLFEVNHARGEILSGSAHEAEDPVAEALRSSAQEEISKYARTALADGHGVVHAISESGGGVSLFIGISGSKLNPRNYWCLPHTPRHFPHCMRCQHYYLPLHDSNDAEELPPHPATAARLISRCGSRRDLSGRNGRWTSTWRLTDISAGAGTLTGESSFLVHYYEDGNVQLAARRAHPARPLAWDPAAGPGAAVAAAVRAAEGELQAWADRAHGPGLSDGAFKALRRRIPRTQTRFQWDKVGVYAVARELAAAGK